MDWKSRLTSEKNLMQVYLQARRLATAKSNRYTSWAVMLIGVSCLLANSYFGLSIVSYSSLVTGIRTIADVGFSLTTAILGFLVAGFAIFSSVTRPDVFALLAITNHKKGDISNLQFIFFNFMLIFIHYLLFLIFCTFIKIFLYSKGPASLIFVYISESYKCAFIYFLSVAFPALTGWIIFILLLLKSFIWNLYQSVLIAIILEGELAGKQMAGTETSPANPE